MPSFAGVEITDPMHTEKLSSAIQLTGANVRVINCFVHDVASGNGIFSPSSTTYSDWSKPLTISLSRLRLPAQVRIQRIMSSMAMFSLARV